MSHRGGCWKASLAGLIFSAAVASQNAFGQSTLGQSGFEGRIRAAMAESLQKQRISVVRQVEIVKQIEMQQKRQAGAATQVRMSAFSADPVSFAPPVRFRSFACPPLAAGVLQPQIERAASEHDVSPDLLRAVAHTESGFMPCAVSSKGASGLMQIMPMTARGLGLADPMDPQQSLLAGAKYLRQLLDRYNGDLRLALGAYNAGPGAVDQYRDVPPFDETRNYVRKVLTEFAPKRTQSTGDLSPISDVH